MPRGDTQGRPFDSRSGDPLTTCIPEANLPLRGALEVAVQAGDESKRDAATEGTKAEPRCVCTLQIQACDRAGNFCETGGAAVTCGCVDPECGVSSKVTDLHNGTYLLEWWSLNSGTYEVFIKVDGLHVVNSPATMQLTSGKPDFSKTRVSAKMLKEGSVAGQVSKVRLTCNDFLGNPALPGPATKFFCVMLPAKSLEDDPDAWKKAEPLPCSQENIGHEVELSFIPRVAGDTKLHFWTLSEEGQRRSERRSAYNMAAESSNSSPLGARASTFAPNNARQMQRAASRRTDNDRVGLPGSPFDLHTKPGPPSHICSAITGILQNVHGSWEEVKDNSVIRSGSAQSAILKSDDEIVDSSLQVGDTIRVQPVIRDEFSNNVGMTEGNLVMAVKGQAGAESDETLHWMPMTDRRGVLLCDAKYEIRRRGRHVLNVTLNAKHILGSPIEFFAIPCRPDGRRWEPGEKEKADKEAKLAEKTQA
uniref:Uncharacterized protein n=1 Tax=Haptolina brevifila TaxID=156173 RepID=A0A7S2BKG7_9EUKA|mmetsp:Transcript_13840/g.27856  ORF Transcript_13840/g.27856 Transcript_13840/m.27856 type:complete len:477 (+) Transcript_13840:573-2003(+)